MHAASRSDRRGRAALRFHVRVHPARGAALPEAGGTRALAAAPTTRVICDAGNASAKSMTGPWFSPGPTARNHRSRRRPDRRPGWRRGFVRPSDQSPDAPRPVPRARRACDHVHARREKAAAHARPFGIAGDEQDLDPGPAASRDFGQVASVDVRKSDVGDKQIDPRARFQDRDREAPVLRLQTAIAELPSTSVIRSRTPASSSTTRTVSP